MSGVGRHEGGDPEKAVTLTEKRAVASCLATARVKPERACFLVGLPKSTWYDQTKPRQDDELRQRIRELALLHPRRGYRFIHALLLGEGRHLNQKKVRRIWREEALTVNAKTSRKTRTGTSIPRQAESPGHVWTYDFIFDQTLGGTTLNILSLTDEFTRQSLALRTRKSSTRSSPSVGPPDASAATTDRSSSPVTWGSGRRFRTSAPDSFNRANPGRTASPKVFTLGCGRSA